MEIRFLRSAFKDLERIAPANADAILERIERFGAGGPCDIKKLKGRGEYRLRCGDYRVLLVKTGAVAQIHRILHRREAYRQ
jgi:mRNA-degrading endonuclease RelE of RelBE toxin-antitoxin system